MRTIIELPEPQIRGLMALCARKKISRAEAIRRAVDAALERERRPDEHTAFGLWRGRKGDARRIVAGWREEWGPA